MQSKGGLYCLNRRIDFTIHFKHFFFFLQAVVEEIQVKTAELGKIQKSGHELMEALSGNVYIHL